jgi:AbiV family abortive infection protein
MNDEEEKDDSWPGLTAVEDAIAYGGGLYGHKTDFDAAFDHILALLEEAAGLFERESFSTSAFLAVTAIEETAKAHVAIFRKDRLEGTSKGRDPLRDHRMKHRMAILPPMFISDRLERTLGSDTCAKLQKEAETTGFTATREAALYCARVKGKFITPRTAVSAERAWELLVLATEALDDSLVGCTDHTMAESARIDALFDRIAAQNPIQRDQP